MADERYRKFLGIEPADEIPTYYELFGIEPNERDATALEKAYKTQIRKLQEIRTSKDKGFIEFLKEELRKARRILNNAEKRKDYDESLLATSIESFKEFVLPLMALGTISKSVVDTMIAKGVSDGLSEAKAREVIEQLAQESGATLESEEDEEDEEDEPEAPAPTPPRSTSDTPPSPMRRPAEPPRRPPARREVVLRPSGGAARPPERPRVARSAFYSSDDAHETPPRRQPSWSRGDGAAADARPPAPPERGAPERGAPERGAPERGAPDPGPNQGAPGPAARGPWGRGGGGGDSGGSSPWGRGASRGGSPWGRKAQGARPGSRPAGGRRPGPSRGPEPARGGAPRRSLSPTEQKILEEAIREFNLGAKLAKIAQDVHKKLAFYFPPANGKTTRTHVINGVSYEKVFDTERKMYRDTLKKFEQAQEQTGSLRGHGPDQLRARAGQNIALIKGYLEEIKQHKLRQLASMSNTEEVKAWAGFASSRRSNRLTQPLSEQELLGSAAPSQ